MHVVRADAKHRFEIAHVGPLRHGRGGKAASTRFRGVCPCGYATKWRKFTGVMPEDIETHLRIAEEAGDNVSRRWRVAKES
jgi:hypothetical protein